MSELKSIESLILILRGKNAGLKRQAGSQSYVRKKYGKKTETDRF